MERDKNGMTLYQRIEHSIMFWSMDGTKTAGCLTREILKLIKQDSDKDKNGTSK